MLLYNNFQRVCVHTYIQKFAWEGGQQSIADKTMGNAQESTNNNNNNGSAVAQRLYYIIL